LSSSYLFYNLSRFLDGDNVHESERVGVIGSDLAVNLDEPLLEDGSDLSAGKGELQSVSKEDGQRKALSELVGSGRGSRSVSSGELVQQPGGGGCEPLQVLLRSSGHV